MLLHAAANPYLGRWALTLPNGAAGWLGVEENGGVLAGSLLWGGGSVMPVSRTKVEGDHSNIDYRNIVLRPVVK